MEIRKLQPILEAIIYVADDPVTPEQFKEILPDESYDKIEKALQELFKEFNSRPGGMEIREVAGGYRMTTRPEYHEHIRSYLKAKPNAKIRRALRGNINREYHNKEENACAALWRHGPIL